MRGTPRCSICPRGYSTASNAGASIETFHRATAWNSAPVADLQGVPLVGVALSGVPASAVLGARAMSGCRRRSAAERPSSSELNSNSRPQSGGREAVHFGQSSRVPADGPEAAYHSSSTCEPAAEQNDSTLHEHCPVS